MIKVIPVYGTEFYNCSYFYYEKLDNMIQPVYAFKIKIVKKLMNLWGRGVKSEQPKPIVYN